MAQVSLIQMEDTQDSQRSRALAALQKSKSDKIEFITLAIQGKKMGFEKVIKMIDNMVALLKKEQADDDNKKEYCATQFDSLDDKKKALERKLTQIADAISDAET